MFMASLTVRKDRVTSLVPSKNERERAATDVDEVWTKCGRSVDEVRPWSSLPAMSCHAIPCSICFRGGHVDILAGRGVMVMSGLMTSRLA